ncbi:hypothetical protein EST38_g4416 [Candolleomyces aberdarensis]|uniref:Transmembrane protein n=1 Tax=Candolleomyces aberdarensis TaxID=2316362 RepID=A0A4Q2DN11_9AGAR|nr:hypothetical protein EST38_g4416 [Candolleomyces aberdarensis]
MLDHSIGIAAGAALIAFSSLPVASAKKVCTKSSTGEEVCRETFPQKAKVAIGIVTVIIIIMLVSLIVCIRRSRRASAEAAKECTVEASQMEGPPTVLAATYNPGSGHSIYAIGSSGSGAIPTAVIPPTAESGRTPAGAVPAFPTPSVPAAPYSPKPWVSGSSNGSTPQTAPAHRTTFSGSHPYPFTGMGNTPGQPPKSAFVSGGFPRPLLAGRLKDRIRERPPSISTLNNEPVTPNK